MAMVTVMTPAAVITLPVMVPITVTMVTL